MRVVYVVSILVLTMNSTQAAECDPTKFFDTNIQTHDVITKLAYFENLSRNQFDELNKSGKLGATVPIYGVPVQFNASYDESRRTIDQLHRLLDITYTTEEHTAIFSSILSANGLEAYRTCINQNFGVSLIKSADALTSKTFSIDIRWGSGVGGPQGTFDSLGGTPFHIEGGGGKVVGVYANNPPRTIQNGETITVSIERDLTKPFDFWVKINGNLAHLRLPRSNLPPITFHIRNTNVVLANSVFGPGGNDGAVVDKHCLFTAPTNEEFIIGTELLVGSNAGEVSYSKIESVEPQRILWRVLAGTNSKAHGAQARAFLSVIIASTAPTTATNQPVDGCLTP